MPGPVAFCSVACALSFSAALAAAGGRYDFSAVDAYVRLAAESTNLGCCALVVINRDGEVLYSEGYGTYDLTPFTPGTDIPIASSTKWLSGGLIASLIGDGLLSLDDRAGDFIPSFTGARSNITVRQLMSHTSGLPGAHDCVSTSATLAACADCIGAHVPLDHPPGTAFVYGGVSMQVAGRMAEIAGGTNWGELFAARIARPLGLSNTAYDAFGKPANPRIAGGARSTAEDYARYLLMVLRGGESVLTHATVRAMLSDQTRGAEIVDSPLLYWGSVDPELPSARYGIGCWREKLDQFTGELVEPNSSGAFGFSPWIDLKRGFLGVFATVATLRQAFPWYFETKRLVRQAVDTADGPLLNVITTPTNPCAVICYVYQGGEYTFELTQDLAGTNWIPWSYHAATSTSVSVEFETPKGAARCFGRVRLEGLSGGQ